MNFYQARHSIEVARLDAILSAAERHRAGRISRSRATARIVAAIRRYHRALDRLANDYIEEVAKYVSTQSQDTLLAPRSDTSSRDGAASPGSGRPDALADHPHASAGG